MFAARIYCPERTNKRYLQNVLQEMSPGVFTKKKKNVESQLIGHHLGKIKRKKNKYKLVFILLVFEKKRLIFLDVKKNIIKNEAKSGKFSRFQEKSINQSILSDLIDCYSLSFSFYPFACLFVDIPLLIPYR